MHHLDGDLSIQSIKLAGVPVSANVTSEEADEVLAWQANVCPLVIIGGEGKRGLRLQLGKQHKSFKKAVSNKEVRRHG